MQRGILRSASQGAEGMLPGQGAGACKEEYKGVPTKVLKACCLAKELGHAERNAEGMLPGQGAGTCREEYKGVPGQGAEGMMPGQGAGACREEL